MWRETTRHERNMKIWREELADFVPDRVLDCHVHIWNSECMPAGATWDCAGHPIRGYTFDELRRDLAETYPDRWAGAVCFGMPDTKYDLAVNNRYVAVGCDHERFFPFRLIDPHEDPSVVRKDVVAQGFVGLKPYLDYVRKADPNLVEIPEMLPDGIMRIADELRLLVMLHIPRKLRLADPLNQRQIVELCRAWPRAKIVLAHIGRAYYLKNIVGQLDAIKDLPNLYYDLTMVNHWEVMEYLFANVPHDRILYGTDIPIALAPGKSVEINDQYTYVTPVPWAMSISDDRGKLVFTSFLYEELRAVKRAVERLGLPRSFVEAVFYDNGMRLLRSVPRPGKKS
ncbi:MAG TPA: amidohydrolase family protein [Phycisphaerae bacterium]|nr:amidohydrolase family protein [Phycisphaerae bacterium]